jgi:Ala-tRNA(Pro) deacylase
LPFPDRRIRPAPCPQGRILASSPGHATDPWTEEAAMSCEKLLDFLENQGVEYELVDHPHAYAARETAAKAGVSGRVFAKTVLVKLDGMMAMAVVPADHKINFNVLREVAGAGTISLALEDEFADRFPDCDLGAMPPFGNLYGMRVLVDEHLGDAETITFNAGSHTEALTMAHADFMRLVEPVVARFTFQPLLEFRDEA